MEAFISAWWIAMLSLAVIGFACLIAMIVMLTIKLLRND